MTAHPLQVEQLAPDHDLASFDCGEPAYDLWLTRHAGNAVRAGVSAVYVLLEGTEEARRVVGYYAISPTQIVRDDAPGSMSRGWPAAVPGWRLGKLAIHRDLRADKDGQWGRQLLRHALETIVRVAGVGGGKVIVVDADNVALTSFYRRAGFKSAGQESDLSLYMKVSTARAALGMRSCES